MISFNQQPTDPCAPDQIDVFTDAALQPQLQDEVSAQASVEAALAEAISRFYSGDFGRIPTPHQVTAAANAEAREGIVYGLYPHPHSASKSLLVKYDYDRPNADDRPYCQIWNHYAPVPQD